MTTELPMMENMIVALSERLRSFPDTNPCLEWHMHPEDFQELRQQDSRGSSGLGGFLQRRASDEEWTFAGYLIRQSTDVESWSLVDVEPDRGQQDAPRQAGLYWVRHTPDSVWLPAVYHPVVGWDLIGCQTRLDPERPRRDSDLSEIGPMIEVPAQLKGKYSP